jgi:hypothetical protein
MPAALSKRQFEALRARILRFGKAVAQAAQKQEPTGQ